MLARSSKMLFSSKLSLPQTFQHKMVYPAMRYFSAGTGNFLKILQKELKYESENYTVDEGLQSYIQKQKLKVIEDANTSEIKMTKQINQEQALEIIFKATPPPLQEEEESKEGEQQKEDQEQLQAQYNDFQINIINQKSNQGLAYFLTAVNNDIQINQIQFLPQIKQSEQQNQELYQGPDFETLDSELQNSFFEFLQVCGVSQELVEFIQAYSVDKEQRLYIEWLKNLNDFIGK